MQGRPRRAGSPDLTPPGGREVVCLHGLGRSPADWDGVRAGLGRFGEVVAPSLPRSPERAIAIADAAARPGSIVIGHSFGGVLALRLAHRQSGPPAALVLTDCFFPPARNGRTTLATLRDYGSHRIAYLRALRGRSGAPLESSPRSGGFTALSALIRLGVNRGEFDATADAVTAPVLVVHARDDHHVPLDFALAAVARHPRWDVAVLERGGHHAHVTEPEEWLEAVAPFLGGLSSRSNLGVRA
jgi:pimeloyl-ACP methyl ester carboxylesterase